MRCVLRAIRVFLLIFLFCDISFKATTPPYISQVGDGIGFSKFNLARESKGALCLGRCLGWDGSKSDSANMFFCYGLLVE